MNDKVADFGSFKERRIVRVWEHNCGGQQFWIRENGQIECVKCYTIISLQWTDPGDKEDADNNDMCLVSDLMGDVL